MFTSDFFNPLKNPLGLAPLSATILKRCGRITKSDSTMFCLLAAALAYEPMIVPWPNSLTDKNGTWTLTQNAQIGYSVNSDEAKRVANFAATQLRKSTGYALNVVSGDVSDGIFFGAVQGLEDEEYTLDMDAHVAKISGSKYAGLFWGYQTLLQLLPAEATLETKQSVAWVARTVHVEDKPRFGYRGVMADPSRHWLNATEIKMIIDRMARYKLNYFHFHVADDHGWRLESKKYPLLTEIGSIRDSSPKRWSPNEDDNVPYGPYWYRIEEVKEIIAYAQERSIEIVPEIEMPGHGLALLTAYPEYSCTGGPFRPFTHWGVQDNLYCAGNDATITFLEDLLDEVMELFKDSKYIHVGGDECPKTKWKACPKCQQRIKDAGLKSEDQLQFWMVKHFSQYIHSKGKTAIEWDDFINQGIPENTIVMAWLGGGAQAAKNQMHVVQAPVGVLYFPQYQFTAFDGYEYPGGLHSLKTAYQYDPHGGVEEQYRGYIMGAEAPIWGEYIWNITDYDWKLFPRGMALAELTWTNLNRKSWPRFLSMMARSKIADIRKNGVNSAPLTITPEGEWHKDEIPSDRWVNMQWPVKGNFDNQGNIEAAFIWREGTNGLKIKNVKLVVDGQVMSQDDHESVAWDATIGKNLYSLKTTKSVKASKLIVLTADVMGDGGSDTQGSVYCYSV